MYMYKIRLNGQLIGTTLFEHGDPPMGCVDGKIMPLIPNLNYDFIKNFYTANGIQLAFDSPEEKMISTYMTDLLTVETPAGLMMESYGNQIQGSDIHGCYICLEGVIYPSFEEEFPAHCKKYYGE
ncbi:MAG: hypothetical protein RL757_1418 [Bacteroidota bacterium]|jgi:hypothetical protein